jgi:hypothetical protein
MNLTRYQLSQVERNFNSQTRTRHCSSPPERSNPLHVVLPQSVFDVDRSALTEVGTAYRGSPHESQSRVEIGPPIPIPWRFCVRRQTRGVCTLGPTCQWVVWLTLGVVGERTWTCGKSHPLTRSIPLGCVGPTCQAGTPV